MKRCEQNLSESEAHLLQPFKSPNSFLASRKTGMKSTSARIVGIDGAMVWLNGFAAPSDNLDGPLRCLVGSGKRSPGRSRSGWKPRGLGLRQRLMSRNPLGSYELAGRSDMPCCPMAKWRPETAEATNEQTSNSQWAPGKGLHRVKASDELVHNHSSRLRIHQHLFKALTHRV